MAEGTSHRLRSRVLGAVAAVALAGGVAFGVSRMQTQPAPQEDAGVVEAPVVAAVNQSVTVIDGPIFNERLKELMAAEGKTLEDATALKFFVNESNPPTFEELQERERNGNPFKAVDLTAFPSSTPSDKAVVWAVVAPSTPGTANPNEYEISLFTTGARFILPENCESMFAGLRGLVETSLTDLGQSNTLTSTYPNELSSDYIDTQYVVYLGSMFEDCSSLQNFHLTEWDTSSAYDMHSMFEGCVKLEELEISAAKGQGTKGGFVGSNVVRLDHFFQDCERLLAVGSDRSKYTDGSSLALDKWNDAVANYNSNNSNPVPNPRDYAEDGWHLEDWNVSGVKDMGQLFYNCEALYNIDLSKWEFIKNWTEQKGAVALGYNLGTNSSDNTLDDFRVNTWYLFDGTGLVRVNVDADKRLNGTDDPANSSNNGDLYDTAAYPPDCQLL